jgi:hypothetical protein
MSKIVMSDFRNMSFVIKAEVLTPTNFRSYPFQDGFRYPSVQLVSIGCVFRTSMRSTSWITPVRTVSLEDYAPDTWQKCKTNVCSLGQNVRLQAIRNIVLLKRCQQLDKKDETTRTTPIYKRCTLASGYGFLS